MRAIVVFLLILCAAPLFAAVDMFLKIDGVNGTSVDSAHRGWFEVTNWTWAPFQGGSVPKVVCSQHEAKFSATPNSPAELRLKQMCDTRTRFATLTVDIKGQRHVLQNVAFKLCEGSMIGNSMSKVFTIHFDRCTMHGGPSPVPVPYPNMSATQ